VPTCGSVYRRHRVRRAVKTLEMTERRMTPAQVSEAQQLPRDWSQLRSQLLIKGVCSTSPHQHLRICPHGWSRVDRHGPSHCAVSRLVREPRCVGPLGHLLMVGPRFPQAPAAGESANASETARRRMHLHRQACHCRQMRLTTSSTQRGSSGYVLTA
jgi:hypothetical protein